MAAELKPYPAYKDSGVPWLGEVPAHWEMSTVRRLFRAVTRKDIRGDEPKMSMSRHLGLVRSSELGSRSSAKSDSLSYSVCHQNDLVMNKYQAHAGLFDCAVERGLITPNYTVFRPSDKTNTSYYAELFRSSSYRIAFEMASYGVGDGMAPLYTNVFYRVPAIIPPLPEQTAIVRFLDHADRRIQRYIRAKQKLIALLEEQKQALIHQAVTGQIDVRTGQPYPAYKPSGVEWLGDVPAHWEMVRNGRLFVQRNEIGFPELPILEVSLKTGIRIRDFENPDRKQVMSDRSMYKRAVKGDIAYNMMRMWQGAVGVTPVDGLISPAYVVAKPLTGTEPRYFGALFRTSAYMAEVDKYSRGIVKDRNRLYWEDFKQMPTPCPPSDEQVLIADAIDHSIETVGDGISRVERHISLFHEYRTRLIADVVTGKLDVREAAARLPDGEAEPKQFDEAQALIDAADAER